MEITLRLLRALRPIYGLPRVILYFVTGLMVLKMIWLRALLGNALASSSAFLFFPPILLAAFLFGRGAGVLAAGLSTAFVLYLLVEPADSVRSFSASEGLALLLFAATGLLLAWIVAALRTAVLDLADSNERLSATNQQLDAADQQKSLLLHEINHRTKNSFQAIIAALSLQASREADLRTRETLDAASHRIRVWSQVHDHLHLHHETTVVDIRDFIERLCARLQEAFAGMRPIALRVDVENVEVDLGRVVSIGLIINELVTNALKYAFPDDRAGDVVVRFHRANGEFLLHVSDNGVGLQSAPHQGGTGSQLVRAFVQQLGGTLEITGPPGVHCRIRFPEIEPD